MKFRQPIRLKSVSFPYYWHYLYLLVALGSNSQPSDVAVLASQSPEPNPATAASSQVTGASELITVTAEAASPVATSPRRTADVDTPGAAVLNADAAVAISQPDSGKAVDVQQANESKPPEPEPSLTVSEEFLLQVYMIFLIVTIFFFFFVQIFELLHTIPEIKVLDQRYYN